MRATSHCIGGEPTGDETPIHYDAPAPGADCANCDDRGTRRLYIGGLGAHRLPCPVCRADDYKAAIVALWRIRDAADAAAEEEAAESDDWTPLRLAA